MQTQKFVPAFIDTNIYLHIHAKIRSYKLHTHTYIHT